MPIRWRGLRLLQLTMVGSICGLCGHAAAEAPAPAEWTLSELLAYADQNAPAIATAQARVGLAAPDLAAAARDFPANPQIGLGAGARTAAGAAGLELEVSVQQPLEIAGEPGLRRLAARAGQRTLEAALAEVRWAVHVEVHQLFVKLRLAGERRSQAAQFVASSEASREVARKQVEAGESSPLVLLVADADLAQTRAAVIEAAQLEATLASQLAARLGWTGDAPLRLRGELPPIRPAPDRAILLKAMAAHHPALRTRGEAVAARRAQLDLAAREAWPEPSVGLAYAREAGLGADPTAQLWMVNLSVPIPLWDTNQPGQARATAELTIADREQAEAVVALRAALAQAAIALDAAAARVALYQTGVVPRLEEHLAQLQRAYALGEVDVHQVSLTRQRLLDATRQALDARVTYYESAATLEGLVGTELWPLLEAPP